MHLLVRAYTVSRCKSTGSKSAQCYVQESVSNNTVIADVSAGCIALTEGKSLCSFDYILYGDYLAVSDQRLLAWPHPAGLDATSHLLARRTAAKEDWQLAPAELQQVLNNKGGQVSHLEADGFIQAS